MHEELRYVEELLAQFEHLPRFADGRIDFSGSDRIPVVTCFVQFEGQLLLLRRSQMVRTYRGKWCTVAGYLDELKTVRQKALCELEEELNVPDQAVADFSQGTAYEFDDADSGKTWIVHPVLVRLVQQPLVSLDWEHTEFKWIDPSKIGDYDTVPMLERSLRAAMGGYEWAVDSES